jgi:PHB/PHA accumulation regulator DNA-binding domain
MAATVRHFKKYANRKFYDLDKGRYVSLLDIGDVIAGKETIEVICDRTERDLTFETITRVLYERTRAYFTIEHKKGRIVSEPAPREEISRLIRLVPTSAKPVTRRAPK